MIILLFAILQYRRRSRTNHFISGIYLRYIYLHVYTTSIQSILLYYTRRNIKRISRARDTFRHRGFTLFAFRYIYSTYIILHISLILLYICNIIIIYTVYVSHYNNYQQCNTHTYKNDLMTVRKANHVDIRVL